MSIYKVGDSWYYDVKVGRRRERRAVGPDRAEALDAEKRARARLILQVEGPKESPLFRDFALIPEDTPGVQPHPVCSQTRLATATRAIGQIRDLAGVMALVRSHEPQKGDRSICCHGGTFFTESSHIIRITERGILWYFLRGSPCEGQYLVLDLF